MSIVKILKEKVLNGEFINKNEAMQLVDAPLDELTR